MIQERILPVMNTVLRNHNKLPGIGKFSRTVYSEMSFMLLIPSSYHQRCMSFAASHVVCLWKLALIFFFVISFRVKLWSTQLLTEISTKVLTCGAKYARRVELNTLPSSLCWMSK